jgi:hypothetical protein
MAISVYARYGTTGGISGMLDNLDGADLSNGDLALVGTGTSASWYILDDDLGSGESDPDIIVPDTNPGTKCWVLLSSVQNAITLQDGATVDNIETTITDDDTHIPTSGAVVDYASAAVAHVSVTDNPHSMQSTAREWTKQQNFDEATLTSAASVAWDTNTAQCAVLTLGHNATIAAPSNLNAGGTYMLRVVQAAGVYTLAFNAVFKRGAATTPTAPAANGDVVIFSFYSDGTNMYGVEAVREEA